MSRRSQRRETSPGVVIAESKQLVERLIERQRYKDAFKEAKQGFQREPSDENRLLLERTYLLRIQDLVRSGMTSAAMEVARHFLEFGARDERIAAELVPLLFRLGMPAQGAELAARMGSSELQQSCTTGVVDLAVIHPAQVSEGSAELREGSERIRSALAAVNDGDESRATELLKVIPRISPWSDWRYFVRGLAAFYRGEPDQARANWDFLDPHRAAHRIAAVLRKTIDASKASFTLTQLESLETGAFGAPVLSRLAGLQSCLLVESGEEIDWKQVSRIVRDLRPELQAIDSRLAQRLTEILLAPLINDLTSADFSYAQKSIVQFTSVAKPLSYDPQWHRLWALLWEGPQGDMSEARGCWRDYIRGLDEDSVFEPAQRRRVQALVWRHIAELCVEEEGPSQFFEEEVTVDDEAMDQALESLGLSLQCDPTQYQTHLMRLALAHKSGREQELVQAAHQMLAAFPNDTRPLQLLVSHFIDKDEPDEACKYAERWRALKPLDSSALSYVRWGEFARARHLALEKRFDEARAAIARAETLMPELAGDYPIFVRKACLEFKAGFAARAQGHIREALARHDKAVVAASLMAESERYKLSAELRSRFRAEFEAALRGAVVASSAGAVAKLLHAYRESAVSYAGHDDQVSAVVGYLTRGKRTKFQESELVDICNFLQTVPDEKSLLNSFVRRGLKANPNSALFVFLDAQAEMAKGPFTCNYPRLVKKLKHALALAQADQSPEPSVSVDDVQQLLSMVTDLHEASGMLPFEGGFGPNFDVHSFVNMMKSVAPDELDDFPFDLDDDDDECNDVGDPFTFGRVPERRFRKPKRKRK